MNSMQNADVSQADHSDGEAIESLSNPVHSASAAFAGFTHMEAVQRIAAGIAEDALGALDPSKIQLCPQNRSTLDGESCKALMQAFPAVEFRVHANASCGGLFGLHDASTDWGQAPFKAWKSMLARACADLGAKAYSWHAGRASNATLDQAISRTLDLEQELGIAVGLEGLYPSMSTPWLMSSFQDYRKVMESGAAFALDLSHWQIIAKDSGREEMDLLSDLLVHPRCVEIHLSDNDGKRDGHQKLNRKPFWFSKLCQLQSRGLIKADVFSEGLQESRRIADLAPKNKLY